MKVYGDARSGNCYKVQLLLHLLGRDYTWEPVDVLAGATRTPAFLARNPDGKIPLLQTDGGDYLAESNAILNYLAEGTAWLPDAGLARARVLQWQFFEQYSHEPYIAVARFINRFLGLPPERRQEYDDLKPRGYKALGVMQQQLAQTPFLIGDAPGIADISLYAYTHVCDEGGFDLADYPAVRDWLGRVQALPGYLPMQADAA